MEYQKKYEVAVELIKKGYLIHCTNEDFDKFDEKHIKGGFRAREGYGFYFSDMPYKSIEYGNNMLLIKKDDFKFLDLSDRIDTSWFSNDGIRDEIARLELQLDNCRNSREYDLYSKAIDELKSKSEGYDEELWLYVRDAMKQGAKNYGQLEYNILNPQVNVPKLIRVYLSKGYDGGYYDGIYTVFNIPKLNRKFVKYNANESKKKGVSLSKEELRRIIRETVREAVERGDFRH